MQKLIPPDETRFLSARWVLPVEGEPLADGVVALSGARIWRTFSRREFEALFEVGGDGLVRVAGGTAMPGYPFEDYGLSLILPGLINLHTHLEYSALNCFDTESSLFQWIPSLMRCVRSWKREDFHDSARQGLLAAALSGTTCLVDSSFTGQAAWAAAGSGLRAVVGLELFGLIDSESDLVFERWLDKLQALIGSPVPAKTGGSLSEPGATGAVAMPAEADAGQRQTNVLRQALDEGLVTLTVAPHAPYTVCPRLLRLAIDWAESRNLPVLIHLCESENEVNWFSSGDTQLDSFLLGIPGFAGGSLEKLDWRGKGLTPVEHLKQHDLLGKTMIAAHAAHLSANDIDILASHEVNVAHCPRSNARLRNGVAPVKGLLDAGVALGFGTDSAASCDDLDILAEARFSWNLQRALDAGIELSAKEAIQALTLGAARIIGMADRIGSLVPGKLADIAVFEIHNLQRLAIDRPWELLLYGQPRLRDLFVNGRKVVNKDV